MQLYIAIQLIDKINIGVSITVELIDTVKLFAIGTETIHECNTLE